MACTDPPAERKRATSADRKKKAPTKDTLAKEERPRSDGAAPSQGSRPPRPPKKERAVDKDDGAKAECGGLGLDLGLSGSGIATPKKEKNSRKKFVPPQLIDYRKELQNAIGGVSDQPAYNYHEDHVPKPLTGFASHYSGDMKDLAETVSRDIYSHNPDVKWGDLIGCDDAKKVLKEAVVYPIKYPQLFRGILAPWKGLLLFGPPGTGKLYMAVLDCCCCSGLLVQASCIWLYWTVARRSHLCIIICWD